MDASANETIITAVPTQVWAAVERPATTDS